MSTAMIPATTRRNLATLAVLAGLLLGGTACGGDDEPRADDKPDGTSAPSAPLTEIALDCAEFQDTAERITEAQTEIYSGEGGADAVDQLVAELEALKEDAPEDVRQALTDLGDGFRQAADAYRDLTPENTEKLAELAPKIAEAGQEVTAYIVDRCS